ncbi:MAG: protein kinase [Myxococcota bacterium]|jgi:serine/threonine-protein kinase|nr:protein kinase [Myxococcota bacterium]
MDSVPPATSIAGIEDLQSRYRLIAKLGSGGMADVFLAVQLGEQEFERLVVIKKVHASGLNIQNIDAMRMFVDEARTVAALNHPHIVKVYDLNRHGDEIFITMEYVDGESMAYLVKSIAAINERVPLPVINRLMVQACEALHYAHTATTPEGDALNLVHRDIDLQNLMVDSNGYLKVIDFGIAKTTTQTELTAPGMFKGKLSYTSPDMFRFKNIDHRVDIYSLGLVLFALVTRKKPFPFKPNVSLAEVIERILKEKLPPLAAIDSTLPSALNEIIAKATHKDRDSRYQTCEEFAEDLRLFSKTHGGLATTSDVKRWFQDQFSDRINKRREFERTALKKAKAKAEKDAQDQARKAQNTLAAMGGDSSILAASSAFQNSGHMQVGSTPSSYVMTGTNPPTGRAVNPYLLLFFAFLLFAGLAILVHTLFFPSRQEELAAANQPTSEPLPTENLHVTSQPSKADLYVDGVRIGSTGTAGISLMVEPGRMHSISIRKEGHQSYDISIMGEKSGTRRIEARLLPTSDTKAHPAPSGTPSPAPSAKLSPVPMAKPSTGEAR